MHRRQHDILVIGVVQRVQQLDMDAANPPISHHQHVVAGAGMRDRTECCACITPA